MNPVAIIGGGITGLTAAQRLRQQGVPVALYEAGPRPGGVIQTIRQNGFLAECGPNTILEALAPPIAPTGQIRHGSGSAGALLQFRKADILVRPR